MQQSRNRLSFQFCSSVFLLASLCLHGALTADPISEPSATIEAMDNLELLISPEEIKLKIKEAARAIDAQYIGQELTVIVMMKGALCVAADLIRELKTPCTIESVRASSYGHRGSKRGELKISGLEESDYTSKNILLVDDIYDSGETLTRVIAELEKMGPKSLKTLVLLSKNVQRDYTYTPDFVLFNIPNLFVIGFGLDYKEHYRGLPGVYFFKKEPQ